MKKSIFSLIKRSSEEEKVQSCNFDLAIFRKYFFESIKTGINNNLTVQKHYKDWSVCLNQPSQIDIIIKQFEMSEDLQESDSQVNNIPKREYYPQTEIKNTEDEQINYYNEYCRLYLANHILGTQLKELNMEKSDLVSKLGKLEKKAEELSQGNSGQIDEKKRRIRRSAVDIARHYKCQIQGCTKSYGSQGSLNQHIKLKHPELFRGNQKDFAVREFDNEQDQSS